MLERILVPLDGSSLAECVLPHVVAMARAFGSHVKLLRVLEDPYGNEASGMVDVLDWNLKKAQVEAYLNGVSDRLEQVGVSVDYSVVEGKPATQIITFTRQHDIDLIVLSSHGRSGLSGWNVSSVVQKIILRAGASLLITRAYAPPSSDLAALRYRKAMVPLDGSQRAEHVLPLAISLAQSCGCELLLAHAVQRPEMTRRRPLTEEEVGLADRVNELNRQEALNQLEYLQAWLSSSQIRVLIRVLTHSRAGEALHDLVTAEHVDLVILSAHGGSGKPKRPYGNMAINFIVYGSTPLLIAQDVTAEELQPNPAEMAALKRGGH